jgi:UPF0716 protein FxsA
VVLPLLLALFVLVPIVELYIIIQVGQEIGALPTVGVLVLDSVLGSLLMRSQGRAVWRRFNAALGAGRPPAREVLDGAFVRVGGALLLTPGFATDLLGIALLLPPSRALLQRLLLRSGLRRLVIARPGGGRPATFDGSARDADR